MPPLGSKRATIHVKLPELILSPEKRARLLLLAAQDALDVTMTRTLGQIKQGNTVPVGVTGNLWASLQHTPPQIVGTTVQSSFISTGQAAKYAQVMDHGRRPGRRLWYGWLYYQRDMERNPAGWEGGWVNRRLRGQVTALAANLQREAGGKGNRKTFEKRAAFLLARKIARKIVQVGIKGREFFARYARPGPEHRRVVRLVSLEMGRSLRRRGVTG